MSFVNFYLVHSKISKSTDLRLCNTHLLKNFCKNLNGTKLENDFINNLDSSFDHHFFFNDHHFFFKWIMVGGKIIRNVAYFNSIKKCRGVFI